MATENQEFVIKQLKQHCNSGWLSKAQKSNPDFASKISELRADQISFGDNPTYIEGYVTGNCTAMGEKKENNYESKRTISLNFSSESYVFISDAVDAKVAKYAHKILGPSTSLHRLSEEWDLAEKCGKRLAKEDLWSLDFWMKEYRLNKSSFVKTNVYTLPVWPVYANVDGSRTFLGYWVNRNGNVSIDFQISIPLTKKQGIIIAGVIGAAILAIILFIAFFK